MNDRRDPDRNLLRDISRWKEKSRHLQGLLDQTNTLLREMRTERIRQLVAGRLIRFERLETFIGIDSVIGPDGRIDERLLDQRVTDLLDKYPEFGVPEAKSGGPI